MSNDLVIDEHTIVNTKDYLDGQKSCKKGEIHKDGKGADFDRGYSDQYFIEQMLSRGGFN